MLANETTSVRAAAAAAEAAAKIQKYDYKKKFYDYGPTTSEATASGSWARHAATPLEPAHCASSSRRHFVLQPNT